MQAALTSTQSFGFASRRIYTFSAGPSIFPMEVLKKAQSEFVDYKGMGISLLEMSHRSKDYGKILTKIEKDIRDFMKIPKEFKVLFLQGGASL